MRVLAAIGIGLVLGLGNASVALANTVYDVTRGDDPPPGTCSPGDCSLREAVTAANGDAAADTIDLPAGTYTLSGGPLPNITNPLSLVGDGAASTRVTGSTATGPGTTNRAGVAVTSAPLTVVGITFSGNAATANNPASDTVTVAAGAFDAEGATITLVRSAVVGNTLNVSNTVGAGGVLANGGSVSLIESTVSGNTTMQSANTEAGGVTANGGVLVMQRSTVSGNTVSSPSATVVAGGLVDNAGSARFLASTISGNSVNPSGTFTVASGGFTSNAASSSAIVASTVAGNASQATATANVKSNAGSTTLTSTIVAGGGGASGPNCGGTLTSGGSNLEDANTCGFGASGDRVSVDPQLGPLQDNGGPTATRALAATSPAVDAVQAPAASSCQPTDQRGVARPQGPRCDIGAFELAPAAPANLAAPAIGGTPRRGLTVTCNPGDWSGSPTFGFAWLRNGTPIAGASAASYRLGRDDVGAALECQVAATTAGGRAVAESAPRVGAGACVVPRLRGATLARARRRLAAAGCRTGRVRRAFSRRVRRARVIASKPGAGANRALSARVVLTVSRGPRR